MNFNEKNIDLVTTISDIKETTNRLNRYILKEVKEK